MAQDESLAESEIQEPEITVEPSTTMLTPVETLRPVSESATITPVEASTQTDRGHKSTIRRNYSCFWTAYRLNQQK